MVLAKFVRALLQGMRHPLCLLAALCLVWCGCNPAAQSGQSGVSKARSPGEKVLEQMVAAYRGATAYADSAELQLRMTRNGETLGENWPIAVTFARPNKLRIQCYDAMLVSDGKKAWGSVGGAEGQVLAFDAPEKFSVDDLVRDEELRRELTGGGPAGPPLQPALLLRDDTLQDMLADSDGPAKLLDSQDIEGKPCDRVEVKKPNERWVYWIDRQTHALKRLEMPVDADLKKDLEAEGPVSDVTLTMEFTGARFNEQAPAAAFQFEVPKEAQLVKRLVRAMRPPAPSDLLGKPIGAFTFTDLDGKSVTKESLAGKIAVLDFWFRGCQPCSQTMPWVEQVHQKYKGNDRVVFLAVNVMDHKVPADELRKTLAEWGGHMAIARDTNELAAKTFQATAFPAWFVIGTDGVVQDQEAAINPELPTQLTQTIDKLLAGQNVYDEVRARFEQRVKNFDEMIRQAQNDTPANELPVAKIAPHSDPKSIKLTKLWSCTELKQPGNILVVMQSDGTPKLLVCDGWKNLAEIDPTGKVTAKHELPVPQDAIVGSVRTAVDAQGHRYFAAFANGQRQLHLFDDQWKLLWSYPQGDEQTTIADVEFGDVTGDGHLQLCVGYWDTVGAQGVSLEGKHLWSNRTVQNVVRIATVGPDAQGQRHFWCINGRGSITPLDGQGHEGKDITLADRAMHWIVAADLEGQGQLDVCGWGFTAGLSMVAVGISPTGNETWNHPLPTGVHQTPIEMITAGHLSSASRGQWVLPSADGSIHIISADGKLIDEFNYGSALTGIAATTLNGKPALIVATASGVDAYQVEVP